MTTASAAPEQAPDAQATARPPGAGHHIHFSAGFLTAVVLLLIVGAIGGWFAGLRPRPTVAIVTNNADPFWDPVIAGAEDAARELRVKVKVVRGDGSEAKQSEAVRQLLVENVRGLGISPIDAEGQAALLRQVAMRMPLVTMDSDSPNSSRHWFVGTDNYGAGREAGGYVRDAVPDGGEVLICVGSVTAENGKLRRQGLIDELLDRPYAVTGLDRPAAATAPAAPIDVVLKGEKYTIVGTCVDQHDQAGAVRLAADAIGKHPDLKCIVALYSYSAPAVVKALEQTGKRGQIKVIGFDVLPETLAAVEAGHVEVTMRQAQYDFGYDTVRALADGLKRPGDAVAAASTPMRYLGVRPVTKETVAKVRQEMGQPAPAVANAR